MENASQLSIAANIAEARAAGILLTDPEDAWGNAAIPGFGIGRPTRQPELDPGIVGGPRAAHRDRGPHERRRRLDPDRQRELVAAVGPPRDRDVDAQRADIPCGLDLVRGRQSGGNPELHREGRRAGRQDAVLLHADAAVE